MTPTGFIWVIVGKLSGNILSRALLSIIFRFTPKFNNWIAKEIERDLEIKETNFGVSNRSNVPHSYFGFNIKNNSYFDLEIIAYDLYLSFHSKTTRLDNFSWSKNTIKNPPQYIHLKEIHGKDSENITLYTALPYYIHFYTKDKVKLKLSGVLKFSYSWFNFEKEISLSYYLSDDTMEAPVKDRLLELFNLERTNNE